MIERKDYFLSKVAKAYMAIIGDGKSGIFNEDSLENPKNWKDKTRLKIDMGKFSVLLTNPPFGSKIPVRGEEKLKQFELGTEDLVYIREEDNKANSKTILRHGDIAFSKIGTLGKILRIGKRFPEVNISQNLIGAGFKKETNKNYIFAYLLSKLALLQIKKNKKKQLNYLVIKHQILKK